MTVPVVVAACRAAMVTSFSVSDLLARLHQPLRHQLPSSSTGDEFNVGCYCRGNELVVKGFVMSITLVAQDILDRNRDAGYMYMYHKCCCLFIKLSHILSHLFNMQQRVATDTLG